MSSYLLQQKRFSAATLKSYNKENSGSQSMQSSKNIKNTLGISSSKNNHLSKSITSKNTQNGIQDNLNYHSNSKNEQILSSSQQSLLISSQMNRDSQPLGESNKLTNGVLSGVLKSEGSKYQSDRNSQSNLSYLNGLYNKTKEYSVNKEQIRILEEEKEMKECYFSPKINRRPSHEIVRSLDDFLSDQSKYDSMKKIKQAQLKEQVANDQVKELTLIPKINNSTKNIPNRDATIPIHERLFSLQKDQQSPIQQLQQHQNTQISTYSSQGICSNSINGEQEQKYFSPRINAKSKSLKRKEPISMILYHDAQRRTEQQQSRSTLGSLSDNNSSSFIATSEKSEQVFALNFVKIFQSAWNNACSVASNNNTSNSDDQQTSCSSNKIDYLRMNKILENLLFVSQTGQLTSTNSSKISNPNIAKERSLVYDLWGILKGDQFKGISKRNLCLFLLALQGIKNTTPAMDVLMSSYSPLDSLNGSNHTSSVYQIPSNLSNSKHYFGYFEGENWLVGEDLSGIQNKFDLLIKNRLSQQRIRHLSPRVMREQEENENSNNQSIEKYKKSTMKGQNQQQLFQKVIQIDLKKQPYSSPNEHAAILVQQRNMQLKKHNAQKISEIENELDGCTFQPNLDRCAERIKSPGAGTQKSLALYKMMFKPSSQKRDKSTYDVEYEKQCDQCTFNPDIKLTKDSKNLSQSQQQFVNRDVGKSIERMRLARQNSQNTSLMFTRGYHNIPKFDQTTSISMYSEKKRRNNNNNSSMMRSLASDAPTAIEPVNNNINHRFGVSASMEWNQSQEWNGNNVNNTNNFMQTTDCLTSLPNILSQEQGETQHQEKTNNCQERIPLLFVDVNIGKDKQERISIFSGDSAEGLSRDFAQIHNLDEKIRLKLEDMLTNQMKEYTLLNSNNADAVEAKN